jgi:hypothetical protein
MTTYMAKHLLKVSRDGASIFVKPGEQFDFTESEVESFKATDGIASVPKPPKVATASLSSKVASATKSITGSKSANVNTKDDL